MSLPNPTPDQVKAFSALVNQVRVLFGYAVNVWGEVYVDHGGVEKDESAQYFADDHMVRWLLLHEKWPAVKEAMATLVKLDNDIHKL